MNKNFSSDYDLRKVAESKFLEASEGYLLVDELDDQQTTQSGLILARPGAEGCKRGVVLSVGPNKRALSVEARKDTAIKVGDVAYWAARTGCGIYDPGLDRNLMCVGLDNVLAFVPERKWRGSSDYVVECTAC